MTVKTIINKIKKNNQAITKLEATNHDLRERLKPICPHPEPVKSKHWSTNGYGSSVVTDILVCYFCGARNYYPQSSGSTWTHYIPERED